jgi:hypothetical protein
LLRPTMATMYGMQTKDYLDTLPSRRYIIAMEELTYPQSVLPASAQQVVHKYAVRTIGLSPALLYLQPKVSTLGIVSTRQYCLFIMCPVDNPLNITASMSTPHLWCRQH